MVPVVAPGLARAASDILDAGHPDGGLPSRGKLEKDLKDTLEAIRRVPLHNADAPDLLPATHALLAKAGR
jgi:hypothetical protein